MFGSVLLDLYQHDLVIHYLIMKFEILCVYKLVSLLNMIFVVFCQHVTKEEEKSYWGKPMLWCNNNYKL
jgi:hypothetical protein